MTGAQPSDQQPSDPGEPVTLTAFAPGRVNLIGEHTDYTGGLVLPVALDLGATVTARRGGERIRLRSEGHESADVDAAVPDVRTIEPSWARFMVGVAHELGWHRGFEATVSSNLPTGGTGLSSSSALTCATLLALGARGEPMELAQAARRAEIAATGLEIGIMDQAASMHGQSGHALLIDCRSLHVTPVAMPASMELLVVHTGQGRELAGSAYRQRLAECRAIEDRIGPLRDADPSAIDELDDPVLRRRARHVVGENGRVRAMVEAFASDDPVTAGRLLTEGHRSLSQDYEVSTAVVDAMVDSVAASAGVYGARLTGGGFGGSLVALCRPGTTLDIDTWWVSARPGPGAHLMATRPRR